MGVIIIEEYKPINFTYYDPNYYQGMADYYSHDKICVFVYKCNNCDSCDAYKRKRCVMLNKSEYKCPHCEIEKNESFDRNLIRKYRERYSDIEDALKPLDFVCRIDNHVYIGLPYYIYKNAFYYNNFVGNKTIKGDSFTPEFIVELIKYKSHELFDEETIEFQKKLVSKFCDQLKRFMPDMYKKVYEIYPTIESMAARADYIGDKAKLTTLRPGKVKLSTDIFEWNGKLLHGKGKQLSYDWKLDDEEVIIIPNENTMVTICDNSTVTEETEFEE